MPRMSLLNQFHTTVARDCVLITIEILLTKQNAEDRRVGSDQTIAASRHPVQLGHMT